MEIHHINTAQSGNKYIDWVLRDLKTVVTRARLGQIAPDSPHSFCTLRLGRYKKPSGELETENPKSELTLDKVELEALVRQLATSLPAMKDGATDYIPVDDRRTGRLLLKMRDVLLKANKAELVQVFLENDFVPDDLFAAATLRRRRQSLEKYEAMLESNTLEREWQAWFQNNAWVLGSDCVRVLDDRRIDTGHVADYLVKSYDGHVDVIEIKRHTPPFWAYDPNHKNLFPSADLAKAITQAQNYQYELEREMNSRKTFGRLDEVPIAKSRAVLVIGRSDTWGIEERLAHRLLNAGLAMVQVLTYDQVLHRARQILTVREEDEACIDTLLPCGDDPFGDD